MPEELRTGFRSLAFAEETAHDAFERVRPRLRDSVPVLRRAEVDVVDTEEIAILDVPRERRAPHSEVQIRRVDAKQTLTASRQEAGQRRR